MLIWRVENDKAEGPFNEDAPNFSKIRPYIERPDRKTGVTPLAMPFLTGFRGVPQRGELFGFTKPSHLDHWFPPTVRKALGRNGYIGMIYDVPDDIWKDDLQAVARRDKAKQVLAFKLSDLPAPDM